jgi:hypothetical protein
MYQKWVLVKGGVGFSGSLMSDNKIPFESREVAIQLIIREERFEWSRISRQEISKTDITRKDENPCLSFRCHLPL